MTDRDDSTGQFTAPEPQTFGRESVEQAAGYVPLAEDNAADEGELTIEEAKEQLPTTAEGDVRTYSPYSDLDANVTLTEKQAAQALQDKAKAEQERAEHEQNEAERKADDERRVADAPAEPADPQAEVEKALELPHVKEAIDKITTEAQAARTQYQAGLNEAAAIAQAAFVTQFPELANSPPEQHADIMRQLQHTDPSRFAQLEAMVMNSAAIFQAGKAEMDRVAAERETRLSAYVKAEVERFESIVKDIPKAERERIEEGIVEAIEEYGGKTEEFMKLMKGTEFSNATVLALLYDVGRYRAIKNAPKAVAAKSLPPVQRPGTSQPRGNVSSETIATLQKQLDSAKTANQQIKIASKILELQSQTRRAS